MKGIIEADRIEIHILMDNLSDPFTQCHKGMFWNEDQYQMEVNGRLEYSAKDVCRACNGLSILIKVHAGDHIKTLLFDAGPDGALLLKNADLLNLDLSTVEEIVISHGHEDHYGGVLAALDQISLQNIPVHVHPELYTPRAGRKKDGSCLISTGSISAEDIKQHGGIPVESARSKYLLGGYGLLSGEVPRITSYEQGVPRALRMIKGEWESEPLVKDERILMLNLKNKGLIIITGCGHIGVVNAVKHSKDLMPNINTHIVMGGLHLAGPTYEPRIEATIQDLVIHDPDFIISGHCTGRRAQTELTNEFGNRHIPYGVGTYFDFRGSYPGIDQTW